MKDIFKIRKISLYALDAGVFLAVIGGSAGIGGNNILAAILCVSGILLVASFVIMGLLYWNCPYCHKAFEIKQSKMDEITICPFCGEKLRD